MCMRYQPFKNFEKFIQQEEEGGVLSVSRYMMWCLELRAVLSVCGVRAHTTSFTSGAHAVDAIRKQRNEKKKNPTRQSANE